MSFYEFMPILLNMSLTASVAIVLVILLRLLLKKAPKVISYALWAVVLFRLLCPVSIESGFSLYNLFDVPIEESGTLTSVIEYVPSDIVHTEYPAVALPVPGISDAVNEVLPQGEEQLRPDPLEGPMFIATYVWMAGVLAMVVYSIVSYARLRRKLSVIVPLRDNIFIADDIKSPFVVGLFRPKIYLPCNLGDKEQEYIILHEQHHIKRLDHIMKALAFLVLTIHWFNPLVWVAFILASKDMEMSCDEAVIRKVDGDIRADYSASLLTLATGRRIIAGTPLAFGEGDTKGRINNLSKWKKPAVWVVPIAVVACVILAISLLTNPSNSPHNPIILPPADEIDSIDITTLDGSQVSYSDREWIVQFLDVVTQAQATTRDSIQDVPNVDVYGKVDIANNGGVTTFFYYVDDEEYFIEQPYQGIYETDVDIDSLVKGVESSQAGHDKISAIDDLDNAISAAILDHYRRDDPDGLIHVESHVLLANETVSGTPKLGADNHIEKTVAYLLVFHEKYSTYGGELESVGGSYVPAALTFTISDSGEYILEEYWEPRDGGYYVDDIRDKFPGAPADAALNDQAYIDDLEAQNYSKALAYMNSTGSLDTRIAELLDEICSSPGIYASGLDKYLEAHESEYQELLSYGEYTLHYCFGEFLQGGQTDLRGQITALACQDIMLAWGEGYAIDQDPINGQDWFDNFRSNAESLSQQYSDEDMEKYYPGSWLLLNMMETHTIDAPALENTVTKIGTGTLNAGVELSDSDAEELLRIIRTAEWDNEATDCASDCAINLSGRLYYYHSSCGTFNTYDFSSMSTLSHMEPSSGSYWRVSESEKLIVHEILQKYIELSD